MIFLSKLIKILKIKVPTLSHFPKCAEQIVKMNISQIDVIKILNILSQSRHISFGQNISNLRFLKFYLF